MNDCLILIDKPLNLTSNHVLQSMKKRLKIKKAGLVGVLDPLATGMLLIVTGEATKFSQYIETMTKEYIVTIKFGYKSSTGDGEGIITKDSTNISNLTRNNVITALSSFLGQSYQLPPMHSSVKYKGKKLYQYARDGIVVARKKRKIVISDISLLEKNIEDIDIKVRCSKGTYIRTLVEDIGAKLGVSTYTRSIRRIGVGTYTEDRMVSCDQILNGKLSSDKHIVDISEMLSHIKPITLGPNHEKLIKNGSVINIELPNTKGDVVMKNIDNKIIGIGNVANNRIKPKRLINFQQ
ncbi:MAG: tRNA pseudouridine(55) synthase TruB [Gammaproteobacteria bacterium]|nr:tRNA pseudouridine(55) synthase TruB [Gammaproteobacteria bacterium]